MADIKVLHVVGALHVLVYVSLARRAEGLDRVEFVLLHQYRLTACTYDTIRLAHKIFWLRASILAPTHALHD